MKYLLILLVLCGCSNKIEPNMTYKICTVIDSSGKTYNNLSRVFGSNINEFVDTNGKEYVFHGNYTVIYSTISGYDLLKLKMENN